MWSELFQEGIGCPKGVCHSYLKVSVAAASDGPLLHFVPTVAFFEGCPISLIFGLEIIYPKVIPPRRHFITIKSRVATLHNVSPLVSLDPFFGPNTIPPDRLVHLGANSEKHRLAHLELHE